MPLRGRGRATGAARIAIRMQYLFFFCGWAWTLAGLPEQLFLPLLAARSLLISGQFGDPSLKAFWALEIYMSFRACFQVICYTYFLGRSPDAWGSQNQVFV